MNNDEIYNDTQLIIETTIEVVGQDPETTYKKQRRKKVQAIPIRNFIKKQFKKYSEQVRDESCEKFTNEEIINIINDDKTKYKNVFRFNIDEEYRSIIGFRYIGNNIYSVFYSVYTTAKQNTMLFSEQFFINIDMLEKEFLNIYNVDIVDHDAMLTIKFQTKKESEVQIEK